MSYSNSGKICGIGWRQKLPFAEIIIFGCRIFLNAIFTFVCECDWFCPCVLLNCVKCYPCKKENVWSTAIVCDASAVAHAPEVAAADSNTDSATQTNNTRKKKKSKHRIQIMLIQYDVLRNV